MPTSTATDNPAIGAIAPIAAPVKAAEPIPSIAPGKIAVAAAARPTPIATLATHETAILKRSSLEHTPVHIQNAVSNIIGTAATIPLPLS